MALWSKIRGTVETLFQLGLSGPQIKNSAGVIEHRNTADSAYVITRGADPVGADDLITKRYGDATYGGGAVSYVEFLLDNEPTAETGAVDAAYSLTLSGINVTKETWKRNDTTNIKTIDYTYTGVNVTQEVRKVFAADGTTVVAQVTWNYTYTGTTFTSGSMTRDV